MIRLTSIRFDAPVLAPGGGSSPTFFSLVANPLEATQVDAILHDPNSGWVYIVRGAFVRAMRVERIVWADVPPGEAARIRDAAKVAEPASPQTTRK